MPNLTRRGAFVLSALAMPRIARAETASLRVSKQFGISYLPLMVMEQRGLVEAHARQQGLEVKVEWLTLTNGAPTNDALISGNLDIGGGSVSAMLTIWGRTRSNLKVRGVSSLNSMPLLLTTIEPNVRTVADFTPQSRIALPAVGISGQAVILQMAAVQAWGPGAWNRLDPLTVSLSHPDALTAMLSGRSEITAHFGGPPYQEQELQDPRVHKVLSSYEVLGGPASFNLLWATTRFMQQNPRVVRAFMGALEEALAFIKAEPQAAAQLYLEAERSKLPLAFIQGLVESPDNVFTTTPQNVLKYSDFMATTGALKDKPGSWQDLFFETVHDKQGS